MLPLLLVVAGALATARLTRLLTADYLTQPLRRLVLQRVTAGSRTEYLLSCAWCASIYVGAVVAIFVAAAITPVGARRLLVTVLLALAYSHVTGRLARTEVEA